MAISRGQHTAVIPASYSPPNDLLARLAQWLVKETALYPERASDNHWIPLSKRQGRSMFGGSWDRVIAEAESSGLVERHHSWSDGSCGYEAFPKAVRLAYPHNSGKVKLHQLHRKPRQSAKLRAYVEANLGEVGMWLSSRLPMFEVCPRSRPSSYWDAYVLQQIQAGNHYAKRCDYGRLHTLYTVLAKQHRSTLVCSTGLVSIDIKQSQPTLLDALVKTHTAQPILLLCDTISDIYLEMLDICREFEPYTECIKSQPRTRKGVKQCMRMESHDPSTWGRDEVKKNLLKTLFAPNNVMVRQPAYRALQKLRPAHAEFIYDYKRQDYKRLACQLQRMESSIVIDGVCGWLRKNHPDIPILTVHDELIVPTELANTVCDRLTLEFKKHAVSPRFSENDLVSKSSGQVDHLILAC